MTLVKIEDRSLPKYPVELWINPAHVVRVETYYAPKDDKTKTKIVMTDSTNLYSFDDPGTVVKKLEEAYDEET